MNRILFVVTAILLLSSPAFAQGPSLADPFQVVPCRRIDAGCSRHQPFRTGLWPISTATRCLT